MNDIALSLVTLPAAGSGVGEFWISNVHTQAENPSQWQFCLCGAQKRFIARFIYDDQIAARRAAVAMGAALQGALFIDTKKA